MTLLYNGDIHTLDPLLPRATALLLDGGRILSVGDDRSLRSAAAGPVAGIDLRGRTVVPGMVDAHIHLVGFGLGLNFIDLDGPSSLGECLARVRARSEAAPQGAWIRGRGWNAPAWREGRWPDRSDLDPVCPANPAFLSSKNGHQAWCNGIALRLAGIDRNTPDPPGGRIERDGRGEPTGILSEEAIGLVSRRLPPPSETEIRDGLRAAQRIAVSRGLTGVHDCGAPGDPALLRDILASLRDSGDLDLRVHLTFPAGWLDEAISLGWRTGDGDGLLTVGPVKAFADGALGSRTADMLAPYEGEPGNRGIPVMAEPELLEMALKAARAGIGTAIHAIGDRAVRRCLDVFSRVRRQVPSFARPRIEHAQIVEPSDLPRFRELGAIASMQPIHATSDMDMADRYWGDRCRWSYPWRSLLDAGAVLAFGSDCPVEPLDPLAGLHAAATRARADGSPPGGWIPGQRISLGEALRAYAVGSAFAAGAEARTGTLSAGKRADLVVLSHDIFSMPIQEIPRARVMMTVVDGRIVYEEQGLP